MPDETGEKGATMTAYTWEEKDQEDRDQYLLEREARRQWAAECREKVLNAPWTARVHFALNRKGKCMAARFNSGIKTWKTRPADFSVSIKYGLGPSCGTITHDGASYSYFGVYNNDWHFEEDCTNN